MPDVPIKITIYGGNRVGKTTLACQFPKPLLLVCFEPTKGGGASSVKKVQGAKFLRITSTEDALDLADELKGGALCDLPDLRYKGKRYKAIVIDSATSVQEMVLGELLDLDNISRKILSWGTVSEEQYRERSEKTRSILKPFLDLDCHTIVTAKEKDHNANKGERTPKILRGFHNEAFFASDLGAATVGWLHDSCDYIGRLYVEMETRIVKTKVREKGKIVIQEREEETGKMVRRLRTMLHPNYAAGFRSCDPDKVPEYIEEPSWEKIREVIGTYAE